MGKIKITAFSLDSDWAPYFDMSEDGIFTRYGKSLIHILEKNIDDPRVYNRCKYHNIANLLIIVFMATLEYCSNCSEYHQYCVLRHKDLKEVELLNDQIPSHDTFRRVLSLINPNEIENSMFEALENFKSYVDAKYNLEGQYTLLSIDGKETRGTGRADSTINPKRNMQHLNIYDASNDFNLYTVLIDDKENEIPVAQNIIKKLDCKNIIFTADALHTQKKTTQIIRQQKGHYVFPVKENQPELKATIMRAFERKELRKSKIVDKDNNAIFRFINTKDKFLVDYQWTDIKYYVEYTKIKQNRKTGEITTQVMYFITSLSNRETITTAIKMRWKIENILHRSKDMLLDEDHIRYTNQTLVTNLVLINNLVLSFVRIAKPILNFDTLKFTRKAFAIDKTLFYKILKIIVDPKILKR